MPTTVQILPALPHAIASPARPIEVIAADAITTARMELRPLQPTDRDQFLRAFRRSRAELEPWIPLNRDGETDDGYFDRLLESTAEGDRAGTRWRRAGFLSDGQLAGMFSLFQIERGLEWQADAVWWVATDHAGQGLGAEGVTAMLDHALSPLPIGLGLGAVHAGIHADNDSSRRLASKLGFEIVPAQRSKLFVAGEWHTHDFFVKRAP